MILFGQVIDLLSYEEFEKYMLLLKANESFQRDLDEICSRYMKNTKINSLQYSEVNMWLPSLETTCIELLSKIMHNKYETIDYFVYDLDFGKNWEPGTITDEDGKDIPLKTIKDLYNLLLKEAEDWEKED